LNHFLTTTSRASLLMCLSWYCSWLGRCLYLVFHYDTWHLGSVAWYKALLFFKCYQTSWLKWIPKLLWTWSGVDVNFSHHCFSLVRHITFLLNYIWSFRRLWCSGFFLSRCLLCSHPSGKNLIKFPSLLWMCNLFCWAFPFISITKKTVSSRRITTDIHNILFIGMVILFWLVL